MLLELGQLADNLPPLGNREKVQPLSRRLQKLASLAKLGGWWQLDPAEFV